MAWSDADIVNALARAGAKGMTAAAVARSVSATVGTKQFSSAVTKLKARGEIRGPFKIGRFNLYFEGKSAPTREQLESRIEDVLRRAGTRVTTRSDLEAGTSGAPKSLFKDALSALKGEGRIVELRSARRSPLYVHREAILDQLRVEDGADGGRKAPPPKEAPSQGSISLDDMRPAYLALKVEQGGISAVKIYDLLQKLDVSKDALHSLLLREAQRGRVSLHPASTVNFPREVMEAGIRVEGQPHPFVTVILKEGT
jgi:hypothetical protein